jgi:hypothetical protein
VAAGNNEVKVEVVGVFEQEVSFQEQEHRIPVLLVRDPVGRELRLPIGSCEGLAIQIVLEQHVMPRPLTHDLALRLMERLHAQLGRVVIDELTDSGAHATLYLTTPQGEITMDARPGDAVALALRADVPIHVTEELLGSVGS